MLARMGQVFENWIEWKLAAARMRHGTSPATVRPAPPAANETGVPTVQRPAPSNTTEPRSARPAATLAASRP
jgi:hypothetical protein